MDRLKRQKLRWFPDRASNLHSNMDRLKPRRINAEYARTLVFTFQYG